MGESGRDQRRRKHEHNKDDRFYFHGPGSLTAPDGAVPGFGMNGTALG
jgi:hypothetical protein